MEKSRYTEEQTAFALKQAETGTNIEKRSAPLEHEVFSA
ncbi:Uncharacterised protein [Serratia proteamaculans]|nr:Uncharacterised protein [Serratia proteamaculans]